MSRLFIGIDPGQSGGLCSLYYDGGYDLELTAMPKTEKDIYQWFQDQNGYECFAVIEKVHAMPGNGVSSMFKFGKGYGGLRMALIAAGIPFEEVTPQKWMKELGIPNRKNTESKVQFKNRLKGIAQNMFASETVTLATADALLIAEYCRRKHGA